MKRNVMALISVLIVFVLAFSTTLAQDSEQPLVGSWDECPTPENLPETVTIGAVFGLSEAVAVYGTSQKQAVELAVEEINTSGYLGASTLQVIFEDSAGNRDQAIAAMTKLVEEDNVLAVIGPTLSAEAFAADPIAQENGTVVMGVSNTAIGLTDMGDYVFRDSLPEAAVIPGTIAQARETLGLTKVGLLYGNDDDFTVSGYEVFKQTLQDSVIEILGEETFAKGDVDFNAQLTNLIGANPDALVVSALAAEATQIILQARSLGYTGPIIGGNGFNSPAVLKDTGAASEGLIVGGAWNYGNPNPSESSVRFVELYEARYEDQSPDQFAAQAYTGAWLTATAIRCGNFAADADVATQRTALRDALAAIKDFDSPLGVFSFDENRNPIHDPIAQIVSEGKFKPLAVVLGAQATPEATPAS
ncbi:MAG TPA: ABC transporter substrate-binding protein [Phototrophicaceae bacterium]|nr:ABC transporter substrate-binding protein [Phototrophicaceae bacterium]